MAEVKVGRWGKSVAIRPFVEVAKAADLGEGECIKIEARDGDIVIHRSDHRRRELADSQAAMDEILADSREHSLGGIAIRELIDEGRD